MTENRLTDEQLEQLLEVGRSLVSELDLETLLRRVLEAARDLTSASYAALGILNEEKTGLERFLHSGIDERTRRAIGPLPRGRGVLGELIRDPVPLRLPDVGAHPRSYGFPPAHPEMHSFLGTPILIRGEAWGNLYLTEKGGGEEFDEGDERVVVVLAAWAAVAIENARLYEGLDRRRKELERALRGLEAATDISRIVAAGIEVAELLELIAKRGRGVVDALRAMVLLSDAGQLEVVAAAGEEPEALVGLTVRDGASWLADLYREAPDLRGLHVLEAPMEFRDRTRGLLVAVDRPGGEGFDSDDERVFESFAASAATTIASLREAQAEKLQLSIEASERERRRWARELHDETLQELGALRFVLESAGSGASELTPDLRERAIEHLDRGIRNLQGLITELRPSVLDELGVKPAIESLARQLSDRSGIDIDVDLEFSSDRLPSELEATIYRLVQESANNAIKHSEPAKVTITVRQTEAAVTVDVADDGSGFDPETAERSFGLVGMQERVALAGGSLEIDSAPGKGSRVRAELPLISSPERVAR
jgi:two-component system, NarL family, sensor histidine kinase DevS